MIEVVRERATRSAQLVKQYNARRHEQWADLTKLQGELADAAGRLRNEFRRLGRTGAAARGRRLDVRSG